MERRLFSFILAASTFFFAYMILYKHFGPPQPKKKPVAAQADGAEEDAGGDAELDAAGDENTAQDDPKVDDDVDENEAPAVQRPVRPSWITLGSMDPNSGYRMLVTTNSRGGSIERIELTERNEKGGFKYRRIDVRSGYLGYFAGELDATITGVRVNVVGPGTPASTAIATDVEGGIKPGDVIVKVGEKEITTTEDIRDALAKTKPGDEIAVEVIRASEPADGEEDGDEPKPTATTSITFSATLSEHPLDLVRLAELGGEDQVKGNLSRRSCLLTLGQVNRKGILTGQSKIKGFVDPTQMLWNAADARADDDQAAIFDLELTADDMKKIGAEPVRIVRSYSLKPDSYALGMSIELKNLGKNPQKLSYRLEGVNGVTMEGWWYSNKVTPSWSRAAARDISYKTTADGHVFLTGCNLLKKARKTPEDPDQGIFAEGGDDDTRDLKYIGVDAQYFNCSYLPPDGTPTMNNFRRANATIVADEAKIQKYQEHAVNSSFFLDSVVATVGPEKTLRHEFRLFAGPKDTELIPQYGIQDNVYYGWFSPVARALVWVLHFLYGIIGNYGIAIVMLTVLVRGMMFPLSRKAAVNAQRMQELAPELKKIAEEYKDDMEGRLKAQRELQQRVGFNPMAGCLPMFLQLPIFIGLYRALSVDIELRQAALSAGEWASNLAGPDMFTRWDGWLWEYFSGRGTGWLGPYLNILPVVVVLLFLTQQKLFMPPATDEQTAMTQKVMGFMTLFMGLFFFRVPAGLCLYFISSSLWGICERVLVKKTLPTGKHFDQDVIDGKATPKENKSNGKPPGKQSITDRIREQINPQEKPVVPPNKRKRPPTGKKTR